MRSALIGALCAACFASTPLTSLRGQVFLTASGNPYIVERSLAQGPADTLIIDSGVEIRVNGYYKILLRGTVHMRGSPSQPIRVISGDSSAGWIGLHFATAEHPMSVRHMIVEGAFRNVLGGSSGVISRCQFRNNFYGLWVEEPGRVRIDSTVFEGNRYALFVDRGELDIAFSRIQNNAFGLGLEKGARVQGAGNSFQSARETSLRDSALSLRDRDQALRQSVLRLIEARF